jgi:hypothetical protein
MFSKLTKYARTPQGRRVIDQAQRMAKDPATKAKAQKLMSQFGSKGRRSGPPPAR